MKHRTGTFATKITKQLNSPMKKTFLMLLVFAFPFVIAAQEDELTPLERLQNEVEILKDNDLKNSALKITGYMQPQWQWGGPGAAIKVGKGNTGTGNFSRFGVRRARLKFEYDEKLLGIASGVFHFNITDKEGLKSATVQLKEVYLKVKDPVYMTSSVVAGVFSRPFGHEVIYSTSNIETPERSRVITTLFPEESDMGAMVSLRPSLGSPLHFLCFEGGLFAGNSINPETDSRMDFIGHLTATSQNLEFAKLGLGISYYNGGVYQTNKNVYTMSGDKFTVNSDVANVGAFAPRQYYGIDAQASFETPLGMTQIRYEAVFGKQPGNLSTTASPNRAALPNPEDTYIRPMYGWYATLVQDIGHVPVSAVVKYDVYDPNTAVSGNQIGAADSFTSATDISYSTLALGAMWRINSKLRFSAFYEIVKNETSGLITNADALKNYTADIDDNIFTARLQFRF